MRKFVEVDPETLRKAQLYCFMKGVTLKKFVGDLVGQALEPYHAWFENFQAENASEQKTNQ